MTFRRILIGAAIGLALLAVLAWLNKPVYHRLMAKRLVRAAQAAELRKEYQEEVRLYVLALERDPANVETLRSLGGFLAKAHSPKLLEVRERLYSLEPNSVDAFLDYVESALMFKQPGLAQGLLSSTAAEKAKENPRYYHLLSVSLFLAGDLPHADAACDEALKRDPANKNFRINQATIRLSCPEPTVRKAAADLLEESLSDPETRYSAIQALLYDAAVAPTPPDRLDAWLEIGLKVIPPRDTFFTSCLGALHRWRPERFAALLPEYLKAAAGEGGSAVTAQQWLTTHKLWQEALDFRDSLPAQVKNSTESLLLAAEALFQLQATDRLAAFLETPEWKGMPALRMAWQERLRRLAGPPIGASLEAEANWQKILNLASNDPKLLSTLARLTEGWGWTTETDDALWATVDKVPAMSETALQELSQKALKRGDGKAMLRAVSRQLKSNPQDAMLANNLTFLSFLYQRDIAQATRISEQLCDRYPDSPQVLATNAFGRFIQGDIEGGLTRFSKLDPKRLAGTAPGVTYGLLLAANKDPRAAEFLTGAERFLHFPEEQALLEKARKQLQ